MRNLVLVPEMALARAEGRKNVTRRLTCYFEAGTVVYHGEQLMSGVRFPTVTQDDPIALYRRDDMPVIVPSPSRVMSTYVPWRWKPPTLSSRFCPEQCARLFSMLRDVRQEPVQAITEEEARREGVTWGESQPATINGEPGSVWFFKARDAFAHLWDQLHRKERWSSNPMIYRLELGPNLTHEEATRLAAIEDLGERLHAGRAAA